MPKPPALALFVGPPSRVSRGGPTECRRWWVSPGGMCIGPPYRRTRMMGCPVCPCVGGCERLELRSNTRTATLVRRWQGCIRREGTSEAVPEAVRQAVGGGCRSGWGRLLSVTHAIEAGICRQGDTSWVYPGRPEGGVPPPPFSMHRWYY